MDEEMVWFIASFLSLVLALGIIAYIVVNGIKCIANMDNKSLQKIYMYATIVMAFLSLVSTSFALYQYFDKKESESEHYKFIQDLEKNYDDLIDQKIAEHDKEIAVYNHRYKESLEVGKFLNEKLNEKGMKLDTLAKIIRKHKEQIIKFDGKQIDYLNDVENEIDTTTTDTSLFYF